MRAVLIILGVVLSVWLLHSCGDDDVDLNVPATTNAEVLRRFPDTGLSPSFYCWDVGTLDPHHLGHRVAGDHICTYGELRESGMDGYWSLIDPSST